MCFFFLNFFRLPFPAAEGTGGLASSLSGSTDFAAGRGFFFPRVGLYSVFPFRAAAG